MAAFVVKVRLYSMGGTGTSLDHPYEPCLTPPSPLVVKVRLYICLDHPHRSPACRSHPFVCSLSPLSPLSPLDRLGQQDNYRSSRDRLAALQVRVGLPGRTTILSYPGTSTPSLAALQLDPRDVRKFGQHRRLWLEVRYSNNRIID